MKIVHAADLHLDSPLRGLERYEGAPVEAVRGATRRALENLVRLCLDERAALLLLAGDLFDGDWRDFGTGLFFAAQMARLRDAGTQVVLARGNHDFASTVSRHLRHPDHVRELSAKAPESVVFEALGIAVHGQSFGERSVPEDLAARYPAPGAGLFNVGLLHTSLTGRTGHDPYAPTTVEVLARRGYDYWALGHVHAREEVSRAPWIVFPGNVQGRHANETGPKGATVLEVDDLRVVSVEHRPLDVVRWARAEVDATGASNRDDVVERALRALRAAADDAGADGVRRTVCVRVTVRGTTPVHARLVRDREALVAGVRAAGLEVGDATWVEHVALETRPDAGAAVDRDDALGELLQGLATARSDASVLAALALELAELREKLPPEAREGEGALDLESPEAIAALLDEAAALVVPGSEEPS